MQQIATNIGFNRATPRRSFEVRTSPLVGLTREFSKKTRPSIKEAFQYRDLFYSMILRASYSDRRKIAELLSRGFYTPRAVAIYFGMEDIDIAAPVLLFSSVFETYDLNRIIEKKEFQHAKVIARRNDLHASTIETLLKTDNAEGTVRSLLNRNSSVATKPELVAIINGSEVSDNHTSNMPQTVRITKSEGSSANASQPSRNTNHAAETKDLSKELLELARLDRKPLMASERGTGVSSKENDGTLATRMLTRARAVDLDGLAAIVHREANLSQEQALTILTGENAGMQASLFRALGLRKANASKMLLLLNRSVGRNATTFKMVMEKYDQLDKEECRQFFVQMGAAFQADEDSSAAFIQHAGHFSAAIAARRREISSPKQGPQRNHAFGKRKIA